MNKNYIRFIKKYLFAEKKHFWGLMVLATVQSIAQVTLPMILLQIIDVAFKNKDSSYFLRLIASMILCYIISAIINILKDYLSAKISENLCFRLRTEINNKISKLEYSYFDKHSLGDVLSKYNKEVETIKANCGYTLIKALSNAITLIMTCYMILKIDWRIMIVSFVFILLYILNNRIFGEKVKKLAEKSMECNQSAVNVITDIYNNVLITKIYLAYNYINSKFEKIYKKQYNSQLQLEIQYSLNINVSSLFIYTLISLIWLIDGYGVLTNRVSIGTITALINYQGMLVSPMFFFSQFNNSYQSTLIAINRINSFLSEREEDLGKKAEAEIKIYNIAFKNIYFQYKEGIPILENVNLELNSGKIVGFIGDSGSGKSTLAKMFLRLYNPQMGEILINKQNIDQIPIVSLRNKIVYAAQESFFFKGSIIENLELGEKIEKESIIAYSKLIDIFDEVASLSKQWNEEINSGSTNLSGGQKKRLDILRMLLHKSDVMIFDESTASLDIDRRIRLFELLNKIKSEKIIIFITHNLEECKYFDEIYAVKEKGVLKIDHYHLDEAYKNLNICQDIPLL